MLQKDYGHKDRQEIINNARAELADEMRNDPRLWLEVHMRRIGRRLPYPVWRMLNGIFKGKLV
ncbi:hypothetical protein [Acidithiobacillus ferridurans]|uniref:Uncharacterized protein n=1 Tax=Acidithiobacillus ferridurans TaxID=1232575 RepID=A0A8X8G937_ACIFI|nr:hypothetical protein [Acidithiobacillus ferridurans]MBU2714567.1 hypothetical protein [Acidithiobacillus ferridurans]MBU2723599.1 hypothetical protein [Acidithiobacillus ferridurans]MBU2725835.1 hypothetical protein [Acidithiobacillus ferridurans]